MVLPFYIYFAYIFIRTHMATGIQAYVSDIRSLMIFCIYNEYIFMWIWSRVMKNGTYGFKSIWVRPFWNESSNKFLYKYLMAIYREIWNIISFAHLIQQFTPKTCSTWCTIVNCWCNSYVGINSVKLTTRVARWFVFKPKIPICVYFGRSCYGKSW
jgi:hypothetical protein